MASVIRMLHRRERRRTLVIHSSSSVFAFLRLQESRIIFVSKKRTMGDMMNAKINPAIAGARARATFLMKRPRSGSFKRIKKNSRSAANTRNATTPWGA